MNRLMMVLLFLGVVACTSAPPELQTGLAARRQSRSKRVAQWKLVAKPEFFCGSAQSFVTIEVVLLVCVLPKTIRLERQ